MQYNRSSCLSVLMQFRSCSDICIPLLTRWLLESLRDTVCVDGEDQLLDLVRYRQLLTSWLHEYAQDVTFLDTCASVSDHRHPGPTTTSHPTSNSFCQVSETMMSPICAQGDISHDSPFCTPASEHRPSNAHRNQESFGWNGSGDDPGDSSMCETADRHLSHR